MSKSTGMLLRTSRAWCSAQFVSLHYLLGRAYIRILSSKISEHSARMFTHSFLLFKAFCVVMNVVRNVFCLVGCLLHDIISNFLLAYAYREHSGSQHKLFCSKTMANASFAGSGAWWWLGSGIRSGSETLKLQRPTVSHGGWDRDKTKWNLQLVFASYLWPVFRHTLGCAKG